MPNKLNSLIRKCFLRSGKWAIWIKLTICFEHMTCSFDIWLIQEGLFVCFENLNCYFKRHQDLARVYTRMHPARVRPGRALGLIYPLQARGRPRRPRLCSLGLSLTHTFLNSPVLTHTLLHSPNYLSLFVRDSVSVFWYQSLALGQSASWVGRPFKNKCFLHIDVFLHILLHLYLSHKWVLHVRRDRFSNFASKQTQTASAILIKIVHCS